MAGDRECRVEVGSHSMECGRDLGARDFVRGLAVTSSQLGGRKRFQVADWFSEGLRDSQGLSHPGSRCSRSTWSRRRWRARSRPLHKTPRSVSNGCTASNCRALARGGLALACRERDQGGAGRVVLASRIGVALALWYAPTMSPVHVEPFMLAQACVVEAPSAAIV